MLKTIIRKLEKKKKKKPKAWKASMFFFFFSFKLKRLTQNPNAELKRLWVGLDSGIK